MFSDKYKERTPQETISIIKDFFITRGYELREILKSKTEIDTYSCRIALYKNNQIILATNGKGMSEDFSLASGYAELYERFCNGCEFFRHVHFCNNRMNLSKQQLGYYRTPDEKILTYEEVISDPFFTKFFNTLFHTEDNIKYFLDIITDGIVVGEPFQNSLTGEIKYFDQRLLNKIINSNGMAAGNTLDEAFNQAVSEIAERIATQKYLLGEIDKYYIIDTNSIVNKELKNKILKMEDFGYKVYVIDLGYNCNLPVIATIVIDPYEKLSHLNFGSFPIFDIALERTLTEIYQSSTSLKLMGNEQIPYLARNNENVYKSFKNTLAGLGIVNEKSLIKNHVLVNTPSSCFIDASKTNKEIKQFLINLFKENNYSILFRDNSLSDSISAIQIVIPEINYLDADFNKYTYSNDFFIKSYLDMIDKIKSFIPYVLANNFEKANNILSEYINFTQTKDYDGVFLGRITGSDWLHVLPSNKSSIIFGFNSNFFDLATYSTDTIYYPYIKLRKTLENYLKFNYSYSELIDIFNNLFGSSLSIEDIDNINNEQYWIIRIFYKPTLNFLMSKDYFDIIMSTIKT